MEAQIRTASYPNGMLVVHDDENLAVNGTDPDNYNYRIISQHAALNKLMQ